MKNGAMKASADTAKLFEAIIEYYAGDEASVVIDSEVKHAQGLRAELDGMGGAIGAAWWEGFDLGTRGTVRALMESHLGLMNNIYDRLRAILIVVQTEDFGPSHTAVMQKNSRCVSTCGVGNAEAVGRCDRGSHRRRYQFPRERDTC